MKLFDLIEGLIRLNIDERIGLHKLIREKILSGNFSRNAYDIAITLAYFGRVHKLNKGFVQQDKDVFCKILRDLKFMDVAQLRSNHHPYFIDGIVYGLDLLKDDKE